MNAFHTLEYKCVSGNMALKLCIGHHHANEVSPEELLMGKWGYELELFLLTAGR
jgi:hypothetical protein